MSIKKTKDGLAQDIKIVLNQGESELSLLEYAALLNEISLEVMNREVVVRESSNIVRSNKTMEEIS